MNYEVRICNIQQRMGNDQKQNDYYKAGFQLKINSRNFEINQNSNCTSEQMDPQTIQVIGFNELPQIDPNQLTQLAAETQQLFTYGTKAWLQLFQAITNLRCINKYVPQYVNQLFEMFGQQVMISLDDSKPKIQRNVVTLINEVFSLGRSVQICPQIFQVFVPKLILKSQNSEHKQIKEECLVVVSNYILNCSQYEAGLFAVIQLTGQKKSTVPLQKFCLQVLAKQIQTIGSFLQSFSVNTLTLLLQALSSFLNSQGGEIQTYAFQICMYLHSLVGDQNFKNWMSVSLDSQSTQIMVNKIQEVLKKKSKAKQHTTMTDMKQRMTFGIYENQEQVENQNHFKEFVKDKQKANNFLDLNQVQPLQPSVYYNENLNYQQQSYRQYYYIKRTITFNVKLESIIIHIISMIYKIIIQIYLQKKLINRYMYQNVFLFLQNQSIYFIFKPQLIN